jgi:hypothetical protein
VLEPSLVTTLVVVVLALLLAGTIREWLVLRSRLRQRGIFRRWGIRKLPVEELDARFGSGEFGTCIGETSYRWARNQPSDGTVTPLILAPNQFDGDQSQPGADSAAEECARQESRLARFLHTGTDVKGRVVQLFGDSRRFDETPYLDSCDVVCVDGAHADSYVVSETAKALGMVRPPGLVLWHDHSPECPGVFRALNELATRLPLVHIQGAALLAFRKNPAHFHP